MLGSDVYSTLSSALYARVSTLMEVLGGAGFHFNFTSVIEVLVVERTIYFTRNIREQI